MNEILQKCYTTTRSMSAEIPCISCTVACKTFFDMCKLTKGISDDSSYHYSQIRGLQSMKCSSAMLQNLRYFMYTKTNIVYLPFCLFIFHCVQLYFLLMNILVYVDIHKEKSKVACNEIRKKIILIFMNTERITNFEAFR